LPSDKQQLLLQALEERLVSAIRQLGFEQVPFTERERRSPEEWTAQPFGRFGRIRDGQYQLLEIQLDKHRKPRFVPNVAIIPPEGTDVPWRHFAQDEAPITSAREAYRVHPSRNPGPLAPWFGIPLIGLPLDTEARARKAVDEAVELLPEIEEWFATRKVGPHMRKLGYAAHTADKAS
jgi:hypothetical protein